MRRVLTTLTLRRVNSRPPSWDATGLVEKAWKRLEPATRDELAIRMGIKPTNLSKLNTGNLPMTLDYAKRIASVVPRLTVADLGAPSSVADEEDPIVLDRLRSLEGETDELRALLRATLKALKLEAIPGSPGADPTVRRIPRQRARSGSGAAR